MTPAERREMARVRRMTQPVRLTMQDLAILREALIRQRDALRTAIEPFGMTTTWDAETRLTNVFHKVVDARCALKRRQHPNYNPAGDTECEGEATDEERDRWAEAHPEPEPTKAAP